MSAVLWCPGCAVHIIVRDASLVAGAYARACPVCAATIRALVV